MEGKKYYEEIGDGRRGTEERSFIGPAYDPESPEFATRFREAEAVLSEAATSFIAGEFFGVEFLNEDREAARNAATALYARITAELHSGETPDPTLALLILENGIRDIQEEKDRRAVDFEHPGEQTAEEIAGIAASFPELEEKEARYRRTVEFFYSIHPQLTILQGKAELWDWIRGAEKKY